jgi:hypothetical protein
MFLKRFLSILLFLTILSLVYIHQQSKIFYLAYQNEQKKITLDELVDINNLLRYDTSSFSSLVYLDDKVLRGYKEFQVPEETKIIKIEPNPNIKIAKVENKPNLVSRVFNRFIKSAEAKTLKP